MLRTRRLVLSCLALADFRFVGSSTVSAQQTLRPITSQTPMRYFKGTEDPAPDWFDLQFDDEIPDWIVGTSPIGYGETFTITLP